MRKDELDAMIKTGVQIVKEAELDTHKADEMAAAKTEYTHTRTEDLENGCPLGFSPPHACFDCDYTDIIGYCVHPINIQKEIGEGRALPLHHNPTIPEVAEDRKRQVAARIFKEVDKR
jgi:hypothetical protein